MIFEELEEYKKDLKQLLKKYRTLVDDIAVVFLQQLLQVFFILLQFFKYHGSSVSLP